ncbi:MAG: aldehyde dehydrogenase [Bacteroidales bacterium]|jgi:aldehyde dehydrogenase (NAD+)|nr:aldehyde dehydrogenase [Bacteroidales bacterium]
MNKFSEILQKQRAFFDTGKSKDVNFRIESLKKLKQWICRHDEEIMAALKADLNKPPFEAYATEIGTVLDELKCTLKHICKWTRSKYVISNLKNFPSHGRIYPEPFGVTLIMSPWNYPFMLTVAPIIAAVSAGNCAIVKPSAYSPATSSLIAKMIDELFQNEHVTVVEGGREENKALLDENYDLVFFTGSTTVGKTVMQAAAQNLTPVILELGGKSPCIVDETANMKIAAKRIVWGKFVNAGQTCVAPDYIYVQESIKEKLLDEMKTAIREMYGEKPYCNPNYPKIINEKHFNRLLGLVEKEKVVFGGKSNIDTLQIEPTIIENVDWVAPVMCEEIFGPIIPVLTYSNMDEVVKIINSRPKPLAAYLFSNSKKVARNFLRNISFGGGCINDTIVHLSVSRLPFGGVGASGMGNYHGKAGFDAFTHYKSVLHKSKFIDIPLRYPPYTELSLKLLKKL